MKNKKAVIMTAIVCTAVVFCFAQKAALQPQQNAPPAIKSLQTAQQVDTAKTAGRPDSAAASRPSTVSLGKLRVVSTPDSALVVVDSVEKGLTPAAIDSLPIGRHTVLVRKKNYFVKKIPVDVRADTLQEVAVTLVRPGCLVVKSEPAGARVFFDGRESGFTPWENSKIKPGAYTLRLEYPQRSAAERSLTVKEGACDTIMVDLPFTKAYLDSVTLQRRRQDEAKRKTTKTVNMAVFGAFLLFGVVIVLIESSSVK